MLPLRPEHYAHDYLHDLISYSSFCKVYSYESKSPQLDDDRYAFMKLASGNYDEYFLRNIMPRVISRLSLRIQKEGVGEIQDIQLRSLKKLEYQLEWLIGDLEQRRMYEHNYTHLQMFR